jgi:hypothetical protein
MPNSKQGMKKVYILIIAMLVSACGFAQRAFNSHAEALSAINPYEQLFSNAGTTARTTEIGDTLIMRNIPDAGTLVLYTAGVRDSGYLTGTDYANDLGFAEHYYINGNDSSLMVLGVFAQFGGSVSDTSTQTISLDIWGQGPEGIITDSLYYNGFPGTAADTLVVPVTQLGIGKVFDTMKLFLFAQPVAMWSSFFAGYNISYNFGTLTDTIGLASSIDSTSSAYDYAIAINRDTFVNIDTISLSTDTLIDSSYHIIRNVRNATLESDNNWYDNLTQNDSMRNHLAIYPLVAILGPTGTKSISSANLTFYGNYPNPATSYTNIKFSLLKPDDVTVQVLDMKGSLMSVLKQPNQVTGTHIIPVNTSGMPPGDYIYLVRTSSGDGIAGKMTVCH